LSRLEISENQLPHVVRRAADFDRLARMALDDETTEERP
jgi:hypothetical protein